MLNTKNKSLLLHFVFWVLYYVLFGIIWVKDGNYKDSFQLEFVLLPIRIFSVYFTVLYLLPKFLLKKRFIKFIVYYFILLVFASFLQRIFMYLFIENNQVLVMDTLFTVSVIIRAIVLINTTVLLVLSIYVLNYYFKEREKNELINETNTESKVLELKSNKRQYYIDERNIIRLEGLGNYVTYHLKNEGSIVVYGGLKDALKILSKDFIRVHKSHIINKNSIVSYSKENIELNNTDIVPIGNSVNLDFNVLK